VRRTIWLVAVSIALVAGLFLFVFPTRTYLAQRSSLAHEQALVSQLAAQNQSLSTQVRSLNSDGEIERIAREQYGLVRPGQEAYAILPAPSGAGAPPTAGAPATGAGPSPSAGTAGGPAAGAGPAVVVAGSPAPTGPHRTQASGLWSRLWSEITFWK